jgi:tRNA U34 5-methylaminomethyl-2-thiouridine-forming methyltransferase MnmC
MEKTIITTADGSTSLFIPELNETYHSHHGALQEAIHVFIQEGIRPLAHLPTLTIFEMGFGTGLNALLALTETFTTPQQIHYIGIEAFPVSVEQAIEMNYVELVEQQTKTLFEAMHRLPWNTPHQLTDRFSFTKINQKIETYVPNDASIDLLFFDAFGPRAQQEMWELPILEKMYRLLKKNGVLVTYCAKGEVKRNLKKIGFEIEALPGPPGKREMTRATKRIA